MNQHAPFLHPYDGMIPLSVAGYILGTVLLLVHLYALVKRQQVQAFLLASPRNHLLAQILLAGGLFWFFLLVAPEGLGVLSRFRVGLAEFEGIRWLLQLACPVFLVLMVTQVKNLLFPRALGIFGLMVAAPLLSAAFLQEPVTRLLIPIWCYIVIFLSILWIASPTCTATWSIKYAPNLLGGRLFAWEEWPMEPPFCFAPSCGGREAASSGTASSRRKDIQPQEKASGKNRHTQDGSFRNGLFFPPAARINSGSAYYI